MWGRRGHAADTAAELGLAGGRGAAGRGGRVRGSGCGRPGPGPVPRVLAAAASPAARGLHARVSFLVCCYFSIPAQREPFSQTKHPAALPGRTTGARTPRSVSLRVGWGALYVPGDPFLLGRTRPAGAWGAARTRQHRSLPPPRPASAALRSAVGRPQEKGAEQRFVRLSRIGSRFSESLWCFPHGV